MMLFRMSRQRVGTQLIGKPKPLVSIEQWNVQPSLPFDGDGNSYGHEKKGDQLV